MVSKGVKKAGSHQIEGDRQRSGKKLLTSDNVKKKREKQNEENERIQMRCSTNEVEM